ncbi:unnamed protein product [Lepidochelys olivacea]
MVKVTLRGRQLVGGLYGAEKRQSEKNYFPLQKLMIMSSYLMDSNYIDPKFPPCEEYSQNNYIPDHSPEYYSRTRESSFQHHHQELYPPPRPNYPERQYSCANIQAPGNPAAHQRGHGQTQGGHHLSEKPQQLCEQTALSSSSTSPSPAPPACNQPNPEHPNSTASKQPIVYPWMKKIHVSTGRQLFILSLCSVLPSYFHTLLSLARSLVFFFSPYFLPFHESLWVSTIELDLRLGMGNYTHHKFYSQASLGSLSHVVHSVMYV